MYKQAFALGQGLAADEIGTMYLVGNEILPNVAEAFRWYEKGAEMEEAASWYHLGICYAEGLGTEINRDKALEYLYRAYAAEYPGALEYITDNMQIRLQEGNCSSSEERFYHGGKTQMNGVEKILSAQGETDCCHYPTKYFYTGKEKILLLAEKR